MVDIQTSLIVDATLDALIAASALTWTLILAKALQHLRIAFHNKRYGGLFWKAANIRTAAELDYKNGPAARIASAGFGTLLETQNGASTHDLAHLWDRKELLERRLRQQILKEREALEGGLSILATIGSVSPFVGLFGTVWGIMGALTNIGKTGKANLEIVAGPIGEALVATAVGIAVAVPAVIGYNFFVRRNKSALAFLDDFATDFMHLSLKFAYILRSEEHDKPIPGNVTQFKSKNVRHIERSGINARPARRARA